MYRFRGCRRLGGLGEHGTGAQTEYKRPKHHNADDSFAHTDPSLLGFENTYTQYSISCCAMSIEGCSLFLVSEKPKPQTVRLGAGNMELKACTLRVILAQLKNSEFGQTF